MNQVTGSELKLWPLRLALEGVGKPLDTGQYNWTPVTHVSFFVAVAFCLVFFILNDCASN